MTDRIKTWCAGLSARECWLVGLAGGLRHSF